MRSPRRSAMVISFLSSCQRWYFSFKKRPRKHRRGREAIAAVLSALLRDRRGCGFDEYHLRPLPRLVERRAPRDSEAAALDRTHDVVNARPPGGLVVTAIVPARVDDFRD